MTTNLRVLSKGESHKYISLVQNTFVNTTPHVFDWTAKNAPFNLSSNLCYATCQSKCQNLSLHITVWSRIKSAAASCLLHNNLNFEFIWKKQEKINWVKNYYGTNKKKWTQLIIQIVAHYRINSYQIGINTVLRTNSFEDDITFLLVHNLITTLTLHRFVRLLEVKIKGFFQPRFNMVRSIIDQKMAFWMLSTSPCKRSCCNSKLQNKSNITFFHMILIVLFNFYFSSVDGLTARLFLYPSGLYCG